MAGSPQGRDRALAWARFTPAGPVGAPNLLSSNALLMSL